MNTRIVDVVLESANYLKQAIDAVESATAGAAWNPILENGN